MALNSPIYRQINVLNFVVVKFLSENVSPIRKTPFLPIKSRAERGHPTTWSTALLDRLSLYEIRSETLARLDTLVDEVVSLLRQVSLLAMEIEIEKEADGEIIPTRISRRD
tara:strand:- start:122 stop:454 length:333 start_codon:yes stop_codon:yes gene_type:complete